MCDYQKYGYLLSVSYSLNYRITLSLQKFDKLVVLIQVYAP